MELAFTISKQEAAERQLETAVKLFLHDGDACSLHTLAAAAYNIVRDLRRGRGLAPMLVKELAVEHFGASSTSAFNRAENFLKHADRDADEYLEVSIEQGLLLIWDAARGLAELTRRWSPLLRVFDEWYVVTHPNIAGRTWTDFTVQLMTGKPRQLPNKRRFFSHRLRRQEQSDIATS
jgi:hypothetical protein